MIWVSTLTHYYSNIVMPVMKLRTGCEAKHHQVVQTASLNKEIKYINLVQKVRCCRSIGWGQINIGICREPEERLQSIQIYILRNCLGHSSLLFTESIRCTG